MHRERSVVVAVFAGGTISALPRENDGAREGGKVFELIQLLQQKRPQTSRGIKVEDGKIVFRGLSENIIPDIQREIVLAVEEALNRGVGGVLVPHGTDSLILTAQKIENELGEKVAKSNQRVAVTGAENDTHQPQTDAWENLGDSVEYAGNNDLPGGVKIVFHGRRISPKLAVVEPFNGSRLNYISSDDPDYQPLKIPVSSDKVCISQVNRVMTAEQVADLERGILQHPGRIVIYELYHSGTAHTARADLSIAKMTERLRSAGKLVFGATENGQPVDLHAYETSVELRNAGVIPGYSLTLAALAARANLSVETSNAQMIDFILSGELVYSDDISKLKTLYAV